ncbi:MAG: ATP-binding protein, partial [Paeniclostridium sordellii]|nr:ATP-binding protein [Paeniclostridium sordellii]
QLIDDIFKNIKPSENYKEARHLFGSALSPLGHVEFTDTVLEDIDKVYYLNGKIGTGKTTLLNKVVNKAVENGLEVEVFHAPLLPEKIETIVIKDLNISITTSKLFESDNFEIIDLNQFLDKNMQEKYKNELEFSQNTLDNLVSYGLLNIRKAKEEHDKLEKFYIPNMNFEEVNKLKDLIVDRIIKYDEK